MVFTISWIQIEGMRMYVALFTLWIIFNGRFTPEVAVIGLIVSAVIFLFICKFMDYSLRKEKMLYIMIPWMIRYFFILLSCQSGRFLVHDTLQVRFSYAGKFAFLVGL